mmetsp:Transcript_22294/g.47014  ORF Transcript_22294/g.47014 Transcript_22294/m.47014 type:complete len:208 (+) Transcript_22294:246-869(+)
MSASMLYSLMRISLTLHLPWTSEVGRPRRRRASVPLMRRFSMSSTCDLKMMPSLTFARRPQALLSSQKRRPAPLRARSGLPPRAALIPTKGLVRKPHPQLLRRLSIPESPSSTRVLVAFQQRGRVALTTLRRLLSKTTAAMMKLLMALASGSEKTTLTRERAAMKGRARRPRLKRPRMRTTWSRVMPTRRRKVRSWNGSSEKQRCHV